MPFITRLYLPEQFGVFTLYLSLVAVFGVIFSLAYEQSIIKPKNDKSSNDLYRGCCLIIVALFVTFCLLGVALRAFIEVDLKLWFFICLGAVLTSFFNVFRYLALRHEEHGIISLSLIIKSILLGVGQLSLGGDIVDALIISHIVAMLFCLLFLFKASGKYSIYGTNSYKFNVNRCWKNLRKYINFPKYSLPAILTSLASQHALIFVIPFVFGAKELGLFAIAVRICGLPLSLIGGAFGQVYLSSAEKLKRDGRCIKELFFQTFKKQALVSIVLFTSIVIFSKFGFSYVFGELYHDAAHLIITLIPLYFFRFFSSSFSVSAIIFEKQKTLFWFNLFGTFLTFLLLYVNKLDFIGFLYVYSCVMAMFYFTQTLYFFRLHK